MCLFLGQATRIPVSFKPKYGLIICMSFCSKSKTSNIYHLYILNNEPGKSFYVNTSAHMKMEQRFWKLYSYLLFCLTFTDTKEHIFLCHKIKICHVCLRTIPFQRCILYVDNNLVISLGAAAEHTRLCDDKRKGLSSPLRIPHKHRSDKPNFAQGSFHLLEN